MGSGGTQEIAPREPQEDWGFHPHLCSTWLQLGGCSVLWERVRLDGCSLKSHSGCDLGDLSSAGPQGIFLATLGPDPSRRGCAEHLASGLGTLGRVSLNLLSTSGALLRRVLAWREEKG